MHRRHFLAASAVALAPPAVEAQAPPPARSRAVIRVHAALALAHVQFRGQLARDGTPDHESLLEDKTEAYRRFDRESLPPTDPLDDVRDAYELADHFLACLGPFPGQLPGEVEPSQHESGDNLAGQETACAFAYVLREVANDALADESIDDRTAMMLGAMRTAFLPVAEMLSGELCGDGGCERGEPIYADVLARVEALAAQAEGART